MKQFQTITIIFMGSKVFGQSDITYNCYLEDFASSLSEVPDIDGGQLVDQEAPPSPLDLPSFCSSSLYTLSPSWTSAFISYVNNHRSDVIYVGTSDRRMDVHQTECKVTVASIIGENELS